MSKLKRVPIGIDNFKRVIEENMCYVDKTDLIEDIIERGALVNLFPRPRRFGKTLTISMLENYFNIKKKEENKELFKGLKIENANGDVKNDLEDLMDGKVVECRLNENVMYSEISGSRKNILNFY